MPARATDRRSQDQACHVAPNERAFHIGDVLSAVTGVVLSPRGEPGVEAFYSYVLGRAVRMADVEFAFPFVRDHVLGTHPGLATFYGLEVPTYEFAGAWVRRRAREFGAYLRVAPLPEEHALRDPPPSPGPRDPRPPYPPAPAAADRYAELHAAVVAAYADICALADTMNAPDTRSPGSFGPAGTPDVTSTRGHPPGAEHSRADGLWPRTSARSSPDAVDVRHRAFADHLLVMVAADVPWPAEQTPVWEERARSRRDRDDADVVPCLPAFTSLTHCALNEGAPLPFAPTIVPRAQLGRGRAVRVVAAVVAGAD